MDMQQDPLKPNDLSKCEVNAGQTDLKHYLSKVFPNKHNDKYSLMIGELTSWGVNSTSDLKYVSEETFKEAKCFTTVEAMKLIDYYKNPDPEILEHALAEIFGGIHYKRLMEIEKIFNKNEVFARKDVIIIDMNKLIENSLLSKDEISMIELFLEKNNKGHYDEMMKKKESMHSENRKQYDKIVEERSLEEFNLEILEPVLKGIFDGIPKKRLEEIEQFLNKHEIYSRKDIPILNIKIPKIEHFFTTDEAKKIGDYIIKHNGKRYEDIMEAKTMEDEKKHMEIAADMKVFEVHVQSLITNKKRLLHYLSNCVLKLDKSKQELIMLLEKFLIKNESYEKLLKEEKTLRSTLKQLYNDQYKMVDIEIFLPPSEDHEILENVANKVFTDTSRLNEIKMILNEEELYLARDDLSNNSKLVNSLSKDEITKIIEYINNMKSESSTKIPEPAVNSGGLLERFLRKSFFAKCTQEQKVNTPPEGKCVDDVTDINDAHSEDISDPDSKPSFTATGSTTERLNDMLKKLNLIKS